MSRIGFAGHRDILLTYFCRIQLLGMNVATYKAELTQKSSNIVVEDNALYFLTVK